MLSTLRRSGRSAVRGSALRATAAVSSHAAGFNNTSMTGTSQSSSLFEAQNNGDSRLVKDMARAFGVSRRTIATFRKEYDEHVAERAIEGIPPVPLTPQQTARVCELLADPSVGDEGQWLKELLTERTPAGVDDAARVKAGFLASITKGELKCDFITKQEAAKYLGTMLGEYLLMCLRLSLWVVFGDS